MLKVQFNSLIHFKLLKLAIILFAFSSVSQVFGEFLQSSLIASTTTDLSLDENGFLELIIESIKEQTPRQRSILATKVEIWKGDMLLAVLVKSSDRVKNLRSRRIFYFPVIPLPDGYHFITVRLYAEGFISREVKWKSRTFQVGIHKGRTTRVHKIIPFFVW